MDLNFGQSNLKFYLVVSCRIAILLDVNTFAQPESELMQQRGLRPGISAEERTADFLNWFNTLPALPSIVTATLGQTWQSFWGSDQSGIAHRPTVSPSSAAPFDPRSSSSQGDHPS